MYRITWGENKFMIAKGTERNWCLEFEDENIFENYCFSN